MFLNRALYVNKYLVYIRKNKTKTQPVPVLPGLSRLLLVVDKGAGGVKVRLQEELPGTSAQNQKVSSPLQAHTWLPKKMRPGFCG